MGESDENHTRGLEEDGLPWMEPPRLAKKPDGMVFGYMVDNKKNDGAIRECSFDELRDHVIGGDTRAVAVPEFERLAPPSIVEDLWPAVQERERFRRQCERRDALVGSLVFGGIALYSIKSNDPWWGIVLLMFALFGVVPLVQNLIGVIGRRLRGEETFEETRGRALFSFWLDKEEVVATKWCVRGLWAIFIVQVLVSASARGVFLDRLMDSAILVDPVAYQSVALVKPLVHDGEVWRLLTCGLLHGGLLHIGFNAMAFANVGSVIERFYGRAVLLLTFFVSVLGGSLASQLLMDKTSLGASGGILGLVGFLLVVGVRHRPILPVDLAKSIIRSLLFMAALGLVAWKFIDNAAHAGGLIAGCLVALPITADARKLGRYPVGNSVRWGGWISVVALGLAAAVVLFKLGSRIGGSG